MKKQIFNLINAKIFGGILDTIPKLNDERLNDKVEFILYNNFKIITGIKLYDDVQNYFIFGELSDEEFKRLKKISKRNVKCSVFSEKYKYYLIGNIKFLKESRCIKFDIKDLDFQEAYRAKRIDINTEAIGINEDTGEKIRIFIKNISFSGVLFYFIDSYIEKKEGERLNMTIEKNNLQFVVEIVRKEKTTNNNLLYYGAIIEKDSISSFEEFDNVLGEKNEK